MLYFLDLKAIILIILKQKTNLKKKLSYHPLIDYKVILTCRYFKNIKTEKKYN